MPLDHLPPREAAVLAALQAAGGRVVSRAELARQAGLAGLSPRRVDGILVELRRRLPPGSLITVRGRGWALHGVGTSRKHRGCSQETRPA